MSRLAIVLAEFGRPAPDVTQFRETWPEAEIQAWDENSILNTPGVIYGDLPSGKIAKIQFGPDLPVIVGAREHIAVPKQFEGPRVGWRLNDYWKVRKLLDSGADIAISFDSDMRIVNREDARTLPLLAERFGLCLPMNPRYMVRVDTGIGADSDGVLDETRGCGLSLNCSPIAINLRDTEAVVCAEAYCQIMLSNPVRGPLAWWRAIWQTGVFPCVLPPQWCLCQEHVGIPHPIVLHLGHDKVRAHYENLL